MANDEPKSPFRDWVQELQEQEEDIGPKIEAIDGLIAARFVTAPSNNRHKVVIPGRKENL